MFPVETRYRRQAALPLLPAAGRTSRPERLEQRSRDRGARCTRTHGRRAGVPARRRRDPPRAGAARARGAADGVRRAAAVRRSRAAASRTPRSRRRRPGTRKIVLATNIAETSLTIPTACASSSTPASCVAPVRSGDRHEPARDAAHLARLGRAARRAARAAPRRACATALWGEGAQRSLAAVHAARNPGCRSRAARARSRQLGRTRRRRRCAGSMRRPQRRSRARATCCAARRARSTTAASRAHGREMARSACIRASRTCCCERETLGARPLAAELAALLSERDLLRGARPRDADVRTRLEMLRGDGAPARARPRRARRVARARRASCERQLASRPASEAPTPRLSAGVLLAFAYPDRIGRRRAGGDARYMLANGRGAHSPMRRVARPPGLHRRGRSRRPRARGAHPARRAAARAICSKHFAAQLVRAESVDLERARAGGDRAPRRPARRAGARGEAAPRMPAEARRAAMLEGVRELGIERCPGIATRATCRRACEFVRAHAARMPAPGPPSTTRRSRADTRRWLAPWLDGVTRRDHLARVPLAEALRALLTCEQQRKLDELAPTHLQVPTGSRIRIDYLDESAPAVAVRLQEVFGLDETPRIGGSARARHLQAAFTGAAAAAGDARSRGASGAAPTPTCARTCAAATPGTTGRRIRSAEPTRSRSSRPGPALARSGIFPCTKGTDRITAA